MFIHVSFILFQRHLIRRKLYVEFRLCDHVYHFSIHCILFQNHLIHTQDFMKPLPLSPLSNPSLVPEILLPKYPLNPILPFHLFHYHYGTIFFWLESTTIAANWSTYTHPGPLNPLSTARMFYPCSACSRPTMPYQSASLLLTHALPAVQSC